MKTIRFGIVGTGGIAEDHAEAIQALNNKQVILESVCDLRYDVARAFSDKYTVKHVYENAEAMFASSTIDAVCICTPNTLHAPLAIKAFEAGLHVLCEKPMATTALDAEKMVEAAMTANKKLSVHFNYRFNDASVGVKRLIDSGFVGKPYYVHTKWLRRAGSPKGASGWFSTKSLAGGGPLIDLGVHRIDLALHFLGYPNVKSVSASTFNHFGTTLAEKNSEMIYDVEDTAIGFIRLENDITMIIETSWEGHISKREEMQTRILGTKGGVSQHNVDGTYHVVGEGVSNIDGAEVHINIDRVSSEGDTISVHDDFVCAIREDRQPLASGENGLIVARILDGLYRSAEEGREIVF